MRTKKPNSKVSANALASSEEANTGHLMDWDLLRQLFRFVRPYRFTFYALVALSFVLSLLVPLRPFLVQHTLDTYVAVGDGAGLGRMTLWLIALLFVHAILQYLYVYQAGVLGQHIICDMRIRLFEHLQRLRVSFFDKTPIGRIVTRCISDIETLANVFSEGVAAMAGDLLQLLSIIVLMFVVDARLALVSLSTLPILVLCTYVFKEKIKKAFQRVRNAVAALNSFAQEHITGMHIVQLFNHQKKAYSDFKTINARHRDANMQSVLYYSVYFPVAEIIQASGLGLLVWYGAHQSLQERLTLGILIAFILYLQLFFRPIRQIADRFNILQMGLVSAGRILRLLARQDHIPNEGTHTTPFTKGHIVVNSVSFSYDGQQDILTNVSFEAQAGQAVAFVGATGAGKTTLMHLICRFYQPTKGTIHMDGMDYTQYTLKALRTPMAMVLQDVFLFSDTLYANIAMGNEQLSYDHILHTAELMGLGDFIGRLPKGLDYRLSERGSNLSVGERQLVALLRAMTHDPRMVILDEATASIDTETEALIQKAIARLMKGRTALIVAHRLSTIRHADYIMVMDQGRIAANGTHTELLQTKGIYYRLHQMQNLLHQPV